MRFVTDENVARLVIEKLQAAGHDVQDVRAIGLAGAGDDEIIALALRDRRIIVTHDKDFGQILGYPLKEHGGVVLIRLRRPTPINSWHALKRVLAAVPEETMSGRVVVVEETRIRVTGGKIDQNAPGSG
ncbi:MAG: DUF5615 family PIN-like protein [Anaerolineae bacterium]|nr:DUF5615 family PIN-like protein [Anaerolineae bacterium]